MYQHESVPIPQQLQKNQPSLQTVYVDEDELSSDQDILHLRDLKSQIVALSSDPQQALALTQSYLQKHNLQDRVKEFSSRKKEFFQNLLQEIIEMANINF